MKILFTGGGTGGHVFPLVAIAREIRRLYPKNPASTQGGNLEFHYLGPKDEFGTILLMQEDFMIKKIAGGKVRRYFSFQNFIDIGFKLPLSFLQSFFWLVANRPDLVFSKGGSGSIAVTFSARFLRIPVFLHESDAVPGMSNRVASKWAKKIFISFPGTEYFSPKKTILTGNPIRKEILDGDAEQAGELFNLSFSKPILLILGGSQGAQAINDFVLRTANELLNDFEIIHVTGRQNLAEIEKESEVVLSDDLEKYYHPIGFLDEEKIKHAYKAADFILSRSGSGSIFEIAAVGKPSILIPLPMSAGDHQAKNAYIYAGTGAAMVLEQENLTPNFFMEKIKALLLHQDKLEEMRRSALAFAKPLAAAAIAREILEFLMLE